MSKKANRENLMFRDKEGEDLVKSPGDISGKAFKISNLRNCRVYLCDYVNTVRYYHTRYMWMTVLTLRYLSVLSKGLSSSGSQRVKGI